MDLGGSTCCQPLWGLSFLPACKVGRDNTLFLKVTVCIAIDRIAFSCESEWTIISTSHVTKWYGACSAYNHPSWDGGLAGARSLVGPQCGHKLLRPAPGPQRGPGQQGRAPSPECSGMLYQDQTPSGFGEAGTNPGKCYTCTRGSLAGRAWSPSRSGQWGWLPAVLPAWGWGGTTSRLGRWSGLQTKSPPQGTQKAEIM